MYALGEQPTEITYHVDAKTVFHEGQWHPAVTIKTNSGEGITRILEMGFDHPRFAIPYARALADDYRSAFAGIIDDE